MDKTFLELHIPLKHIPELDPGFIPLSALYRAYDKKTADSVHKAGVAVGRPSGEINAVTFAMEDAHTPTDADKYLAERLLKTMLWLYGGQTVIVAGSDALAAHLTGLYRKGGDREFDWGFMSMVYEKPFEIISVPFESLPAERTSPKKSSAVKKAGGCRLGFDAGGSDIKVSAVVNDEAVFSEEIVWQPKLNADPAYHYKHIVDAMKLAASKMPRVDAVGVSSAGIYVDNRTMVASLFIKVPKDAFDRDVKDIYVRAVSEIGDVPLVVANDGDVTALAGAMEYGHGEVLGIAMGTSEAGGYVDGAGQITGWLNELAFVPADANPGAMRDEWSGDIGCGVKYFSQDAVIKLAPAAGITLDESFTPAEKLLTVQDLMKNGDARAQRIYSSIGVYLGHAVAYYGRFYKLRRVLLLGRVMSGEGGVVILDKANEVLRDEYPELYGAVSLSLPDEKNRRVGQSVAAASLPEIQPENDLRE